MTAFRHIGGDIYWRGVFLDDAKVQSQLDLFQREHDACLRKGLRLESRVARTLYLNLSDAVKEQSDWRRAQSPQSRIAR